MTSAPAQGARAPRAATPRRDDEETRRLHAIYAETRDPELRERLALRYSGLAHYLARKFAYRGEVLDDLVQVAHVGLLQAVDRFDPQRGVQFATFATTTIVGEIKRHFRDKMWSVHVPRRMREVNNALMRATDRLTTELGRSPTVQELAAAVGASVEDAIEALEIGRAYSTLSLDADTTNADGEDAGHLRDQLGGPDEAFDRVEDRHILEEALKQLPERSQTVIRLRFHAELSQAEIAQRMGMSQMHVSRIQRDALRRMREIIERQGTDAAQPATTSDRAD